MKSEMLLSKNTCKYSCFEKGCRNNLHATIPKGNTGYDQYSVPGTVVSNPPLLLSFSLPLASIRSWAFVPLLFLFEKQ